MTPKCTLIWLAWKDDGLILVKVNTHPPPAYDSGQSDHTGDSDNSKFYQHRPNITNGRNIDLLDGDFDRESFLWLFQGNWKV